MAKVEGESSEERAIRKAAKAAKKAKKESSSEKGDESSGKKEKEEKKASKRKQASNDEEEEPDVAQKSKKSKPNAEKERSGSLTDGPRSRTRSMSINETENRVDPAQATEAFRVEHEVKVTGRNKDNTGEYEGSEPMLSFEKTPFSGPIRRALEIAGFPGPTPTQAQCWPIALEGRDVITVAKTGSGKTCGFLLPAFHRLMNNEKAATRKRGPPGILVLAPTRELACQIEEECVKFGRTSNIRSTCAYGGAPKSLQIRKIQMGLECIIATPGRLNDLLEMRVVDLSHVQFLVLDEADRMLDMGFEPQIRQVVAKVPVERQTMLFSATWPREIQALALEFLKNPIEVKFGESNTLNANKAIIQKILVIREGDKRETLKTVLSEINTSGKPEGVPKTIVFCSRKHSCEELANDLWNAGYAVDALHGDRQQFQRTKVMDQFKKSQLNMLVATDVAARGLDVKDIKVVINYDFPAGVSGAEDYVHRIGRTARGNEKEGRAFTFFCEGDSKRARELIGILKRAEQEVPDELQKMDRGRGGGGGGRGGGRGFGGRGGYGGGRGGGRGGGGRGGFGGGGGRGGSFGGGGRGGKW